jgi:Flp pilus assembly protein TadD
MSYLDAEIPGGSRLGAICLQSHSKHTWPHRFGAHWAILLQMSLALWTGAAFSAPDDAADNAQAHADRGLEIARAGDLKGAEAEFRLAINLSPNDADYLAGLGGVLGMQQKLEEASQYFEKALKIDPGNLTVRRNLATDQWQMGRLQEAAANLEQILKAKPRDAPTVLLLGMVAENSKNYAQAAGLLGSVPELVMQRPESVAALGRSYYRTGQKQEAKETLESFLHKPADPENAYLGGEIASEAGDDETALRLFASIRSTYPDRPRLAYKMALAQYHSGHFAEAESLLLELINSGSPAGEIYNLLAWAYYKQDRFQETVRVMDQAIELDRTKESNYLDLGQMFVDHQLLTPAHELAQKAVERIPSSFRCYMMKGMIEARQGAFTDAVATYRRATALYPDSSEANYNLARMQWLSGMNDEAEATFEHGIKRFPQDALTYVEYALMLVKRAENGYPPAEKRAVALLKQACTLDRSLAEPHYQLGSLWLKKGRTTEALEELQTAARLNPAEVKTHFTLSRVYRRLGQGEQEARELAIYEKLKAQAKKSD